MARQLTNAGRIITVRPQALSETLALHQSWGGAQRICHSRLFPGIGVVIKYLGLVANRNRISIFTRSRVKITVAVVNLTAYAGVKRCARGF